MNDLTWFLPRSPETIVPYPWLHPDAVSYLENLLQPDWDVLEHGSGGSTLWLAERVRSVVSIEQKVPWRMKVRDLCGSNVTLLEHLPNGKRKYDLFFVDGEQDERGLCILSTPRLVKPGGWLVLDNANRPEYVAERSYLSNYAEIIKRFDNNGDVGNYFITEFWQCASE